jgi:putative addiction module killer protein
MPMSHWNVEMWVDDSGDSPVQKWLDNLTDEQVIGLSKTIKVLGECGNQLRMPHSRALEKGLFELRERRFGFRLYYCFRNGKVILLLCGGDKDSQTRDIKKAREIMKAIQQEDTK